MCGLRANSFSLSLSLSLSHSLRLPPSTISTEQETPSTQEPEELAVAKPRKARAVSPTFDGSEEEEMVE